MVNRTSELLTQHRPINSTELTNRSAVARKQENSNVSFKNVLRQKVEQSNSVKFSAHAKGRIDARKIELGNQELARIEKAIDRASGKGAKEALLLMKDLALIVSVKNRTVITVVDQNSMKNSVFTNIDSAVFA